MIPAEFLPGPVPPDRLAQGAAIILEIERAWDAGIDPAPALLRLQALTGRDDLDALDYQSVSASMSAVDAAFNAFCPRPRAIPGLDYAAFEWLCVRLMQSIGEADSDFWHALYCANARNPQAGELVFWPPEDWLGRLIAEGSVPEGTTVSTFAPTPKQLAQEAWRDGAA